MQQALRGSEAATDTRAASSMGAWVAAWLAVGLATLIAFELWVPRQGGKTPVRLATHACALALHLALALAFTAPLDAARRWVPAGWKRAVALAVPAALVGALVIEEDLRNFASALPGHMVVWSAALGAVGGLAVVVAFDVGRRSGGRTVPRVAALIVALGVALGHHRVLASGYEGVHFAISAASAALFAGALDGWGGVERLLLQRDRRRVTVVAVAALAGAVGFAFASNNDLVLTGRRLTGNAVPALAARARNAIGSSRAAHAGTSPWLRDRAGMSPIAPTTPAVLPRDGIVVLVTIDSFRAELMRPPEIDRFPNLKRFSESSMSFSRMHTTAPHTTPALCGLMFGKYYSQVMWSQGKAKAPKPYHDKSPTIAEMLSKRGAASAAYVSLGQISEEYGLGRGFTEPAKRLKSARQILQAVDKRVRKGGKNGLFVYAHLFEPHAPYNGKGETEFERYKSEVESVDQSLGPLIDTVLSPEFRDRTVLIVSADHGEAFGEHDSTQHGTTLYEELMRVPLFIYMPGRPAATFDTPVSLIDFGPTIMDLLDTPTPASFMGQSLVPLLLGRSVTLDRPLLLESGRMMRGIIEDDRWKYIHDARHGTFELYDLQVDPNETNNLMTIEAARAERLGAFLDAFYATHTFRASGYELPYFP